MNVLRVVVTLRTRRIGTQRGFLGCAGPDKRAKRQQKTECQKSVTHLLASFYEVGFQSSCVNALREKESGPRVSLCLDHDVACPALVGSWSF